MTSPSTYQDSPIERFEPDFDTHEGEIPNGHVVFMCEDEQGDWVRYSEHHSLMKELLEALDGIWKRYGEPESTTMQEWQAVRAAIVRGRASLGETDG